MEGKTKLIIALKWKKNMSIQMVRLFWEEFLALWNFWFWKILKYLKIVLRNDYYMLFFQGDALIAYKKKLHNFHLTKITNPIFATIFHQICFPHDGNFKRNVILIEIYIFQLA